MSQSRLPLAGTTAPTDVFLDERGVVWVDQARIAKVVEMLREADGVSVVHEDAGWIHSRALRSITPGGLPRVALSGS